MKSSFELNDIPKAVLALEKVYDYLLSEKDIASSPGGRCLTQGLTVRPSPDYLNAPIPGVLTWSLQRERRGCEIDNRS